MLLSHSGFGLVAEVAGSNLTGAAPNHKKAVDTYTSYNAMIYGVVITKTRSFLKKNLRCFLSKNDSNH